MTRLPDLSRFIISHDSEICSVAVGKQSWRTNRTVHYRKASHLLWAKLPQQTKLHLEPLCFMNEPLKRHETVDDCVAKRRKGNGSIYSIFNWIYSITVWYSAQIHLAKNIPQQLTAEPFLLTQSAGSIFDSIKRITFLFDSGFRISAVIFLANKTLQTWNSNKRMYSALVASRTIFLWSRQKVLWAISVGARESKRKYLKEISVRWNSWGNEQKSEGIGKLIARIFRRCKRGYGASTSSENASSQVYKNLFKNSHIE